MALDGKIRPIKGDLSIAIQALKDGFKGILLPKENEREAGIVKGLDVYGMENLTEVITFFEGREVFQPLVIDTREAFAQQLKYPEHDFSDVKGQETIKRCMEIAAAIQYRSLDREGWLG